MFIFRTERCIKKQHCRLLKEQYFPVQLGTDHLTSRGGYGFFLKKYSDSQFCWKKYSDFGGGKKKESDSEFLS
jgi:hypothetical protein